MFTQVCHALYVTFTLTETLCGHNQHRHSEHRQVHHDLSLGHITQDLGLERCSYTITHLCYYIAVCSLHSFTSEFHYWQYIYMLKDTHCQSWCLRQCLTPT